MNKRYYLGAALIAVPFLLLSVLAYQAGALKVVLIIYGWIVSIACLIAGVCTIMNQLDRSK